MIDKNFKSAIKELEAFILDVNKSNNKNLLIISIERNNGYIYQKQIEVFKDGYDDKRNFFIVERLIKSMLWIVGGYKIYIAGSLAIYNYINSIYKEDGLRSFDYKFMSKIYEKPFEVILSTYESIPSIKEEDIALNINYKGKRIGFDAGGSDIKISAFIDDKLIYAEEIIWHPKLNDDPMYHFNMIYNVLKKGISKLDNDVDNIGISSAGIYINNKTMVASLFIKINEEDFNNKIKNIYIDVINKLENELGHKINYKVANDGDVSALAGALQIKDNNILGIAMGTSEAGGYINNKGNILGWLNELAFVPIDFNKNAIVDEWSKDFGVGCKYLSQDGVIKLADMINIKMDDNLSLADKLKYIQKLNEEGNTLAKEIFMTIGEYLGHAIAYYSFFYNIKHVMLLGRVMSNKGGDIILKTCKETFDNLFPNLSNIKLHTPDEYNRRIGQSLAASLLK